MKTRKQPTAKLPKGRVMWQTPSGRIEDYDHLGKMCPGRVPVAVLPAHAKAQAKLMVKAHKFLAMTREEQVEIIGAALTSQASGPEFAPFFKQVDEKTARAILATIYEEAKP